MMTLDNLVNKPILWSTKCGFGIRIRTDKAGLYNVHHPEISINQYFIDTDLHNVDQWIICEALKRGQIWLYLIHKLLGLDIDLEIAWSLGGKCAYVCGHSYFLKSWQISLISQEAHFH